MIFETHELQVLTDYSKAVHQNRDRNLACSNGDHPRISQTDPKMIVSIW